MREDYQDKIDAMFPDGYLILYCLPDGQVRFNKFNPKKLIALAFWERMIAHVNEGQQEHDDYTPEPPSTEGMSKEEFEEWMDEAFQDYIESPDEEDDYLE